MLSTAWDIADRAAGTDACTGEDNMGRGIPDRLFRFRQEFAQPFFQQNPDDGLFGVEILIERSLTEIGQFRDVFDLGPIDPFL